LDETVIKDTPDLYHYAKEPILKVKLYHTYIDTLYKYLNRYAHIFGDKNLRKKFYSLVEKGTPVVQALQMLDKEFMENKQAGAYQLITKAQLKKQGQEYVEEFFNKLVSSNKGTFKKLFQQINKEFEETLKTFQEKADEFIDIGQLHTTAGVPLPTLMKTYELFLDVFFSSLVSPLSDAKEEAEDKNNRNNDNN
jgi:Glu-tRNA(Gln) amidotransferase subunit E-like FAD-binding protein